MTDPPSSDESNPLDSSRPNVFDSAELFQGQREIYIVHNGELYRLIITKSGKLLLQK